MLLISDVRSALRGSILNNRIKNKTASSKTFLNDKTCAIYSSSRANKLPSQTADKGLEKGEYTEAHSTDRRRSKKQKC